jgi:putative ABC transport system ATP-binding protein
MIRISNLAFRHPQGDFELSIPSLVIERGECVGIIGASGSGKTTLLHLIAGITTPTSGGIETNGTALVRLDDAKRRDFRIRQIGLVFQEFELLEYLDVLDNILLPYRIHRALRIDDSVRDRAVALVERVGLADKLHRPATQLSHGEKQRVAVCRALIAEPELLLADEPTGNLDPDNKDRVLDILVDYAQEHSATLVTVTHDHGLLGRFGRVIDFESFSSGHPAEPAAAV